MVSVKVCTPQHNKSLHRNAPKWLVELHRLSTSGGTWSLDRFTSRKGRSLGDHVLVGWVEAKKPKTLVKLVPLVGGFVGGTFDGIFVNRCGQPAKKVFS